MKTLKVDELKTVVFRPIKTVINAHTYKKNLDESIKAKQPHSFKQIKREKKISSPCSRKASKLFSWWEVR